MVALYLRAQINATPEAFRNTRPAMPQDCINSEDAPTFSSVNPLVSVVSLLAYSYPISCCALCVVANYS